MTPERTQHRREMCKDCPLEPSTGKCGEHGLMKKILWSVLGVGATLVILVLNTERNVARLTDLDGPIAVLKTAVDSANGKANQNHDVLEEVRRDVKRHMQFTREVRNDPAN